MLEKMPRNYVDHEVRESLNRMGPLLPMAIFLRQEIDRMQRVILTVFNNQYAQSSKSNLIILLNIKVRKVLLDLKLAIEGTIIMSPHLLQAMDAMYDARVPEMWKGISWESSTLGFWFTEFLERNTQFTRWVFQVLIFLLESNFFSRF
jgi:dynein heavy chain